MGAPSQDAANKGADENYGQEPAIVVTPFPDLPLAVPFTNLSCVVVPRENDGCGKRCIAPVKRSARSKVGGCSSSPSPSEAGTAPAPCSAPISLPESHIARTPSELLLEALTVEAEYADARMYSRLLCGMQGQVRRRHFASGNGPGALMHPLSRKSLEGIMKTYLACGQDLDQQKQNLTDNGTKDGGWDIAYVPIDEDDEVFPTYPPGGALVFDDSMNDVLNDSLTELMSDAELANHEDDGVFSMEL